MLITPLSSASFTKGGSLRPLDLETTLRAPQQYLKTRVYAEGVVDEAAFVLAEHLASAPVHGSVAFPEVVVPVLAALRHALKAAQKGKARGRGKEAAVVKAVVERVEESARWVEERRRGVSFAPGKLQEVERWESSVKIEETPLGKYVRVQRKAREKRRKLMEKVCVSSLYGVRRVLTRSFARHRQEKAKARYSKSRRTVSQDNKMSPASFIQRSRSRWEPSFPSSSIVHTVYRIFSCRCYYYACHLLHSKLE